MAKSDDACGSRLNNQHHFSPDQLICKVPEVESYRIQEVEFDRPGERSPV